jgi:hypothetical protein
VIIKKPFFLVLTAVPLLAAAIDYVAEGRDWWAHVQYLAADRLQGRNIGTPGYQQAVDYVTGKFEQIGLQAAGTQGYLQEVPFVTRQVVEDQSSVALLVGGAEELLTQGAEVSLSARADLAPDVLAPMVFVGYGLSIPEARWNDLAGLDLRGKIAVYVNAAGPAVAPAAVKSHLGSAVERWRALRAAGVIGIATIAMAARGGGAPPPVLRENMVRTGVDTVETVLVTLPGGVGSTPPGTVNNTGDDAVVTLPGSRGGSGGGAGSGRGPAQPSFSLADPALSETEGMAVSLSITARGAEKFFAGSGHTFAEIQQLARDNKPLPRFPLIPRLHARTTLKRDKLESPNIVSVAPGSGQQKDEYVIMSAHLDHLGVGRAVNGDTIYNGAMDNASGVASVIEVARLLKESKVKTNRSIIFMTVTAEEKGELGSRYFAAHPTVPFHKIVADINLDMFLPLYPLKVIEVQGLKESTLGETVKGAAEADGVEVEVDQEPDQNRFIRSDQYSFIRRGVPSLAFKFGYEQGTPEETTRKNWVRDIYHKPADDTSQHIDSEAAARFDRIILRLLEKVADDPVRPQWLPDSFFRRFVESE